MTNVIVDAELFEKLLKNIFDTQVPIDEVRRIAARTGLLASHCLTENLDYKRWTFTSAVTGAPIGLQPEKFFDERLTHLSQMNAATSEASDRDFFNIWTSPVPLPFIGHRGIQHINIEEPTTCAQRVSPQDIAPPAKTNGAAK